MKKALMYGAAAGALLLSLSLSACDKTGAGGAINQALGNWTELNMPAGCVPQQIAAESGNGVAVLCEDHRVFH